MARDLTTAQVLKAFSISRRTLNRWLSNDLPHKKLGKHKTAPLRFDSDEIKAWLRAGGLTGNDKGMPIGAAVKPGAEKKPPLGVRPSRRERRAAAKARLEGGDPAEVMDRLREAELEKRLLQCDKLEVEVDHKRGALVSAEEAERERVEKLTRVRVAMQGIPGRIAPDLVGLDEIEIREKLEEAVARALRSLVAA